MLCRFQADIAFDGEELARRCLDRCGRARLFKALDAGIAKHDPRAIEALLMQYGAVIVSTTGAEVDRLEREIMVSWSLRVAADMQSVALLYMTARLHHFCTCCANCSADHPCCGALAAT